MTFRLGYISDLHLEFVDSVAINKTIDYLNSFKGQVDFILFGGDTHSDQKKRKKFFDAIEVPYKMVMGNHDFFKIEVFDDFFDEDGIVGACLWTNYNNKPLVEFDARRLIWDYKYIPNWTTTQCKYLYEQQLQKIMDSPSKIVLTHFTPSLQSVTSKFVGDPLNEYFCNNLDELILKSDKKVWIHGHVHSRHNYVIGNCRIFANPIGYPNENHTYKELKIIEA